MSKLFFLAAGGTGGHLFPAFALAQELNRRGHTVDLVTDARGDRYGSDFPARHTHRIAAATFKGRSLQSVGAVFKLLKGIAASHLLFGKHNPAAIIGFGGYPTFPPLAAAVLRRVPRAVHEQNAVMGRANRTLAPRMTAVATSFENTRLLDGIAPERIRVTGNPVRDVVIALHGRPYQPSGGDQEFRLVVFGGSQGARYFSDTVPPAIAALPENLRQRLTIVQQCREEDLERVDNAYKSAGARAELAAFFTDLPDQIARSHLVIGRSGASSVTELAVLGRPSILVPLPHALDNDQLRNATQLADSGGAWCVGQSALDAAALAARLEEVMTNPEMLARAAEAAAGQGRPDAVMKLADLAEELAAGAREGASGVRRAP
ncbi:MAG: undecaprenyldiphospho-muramoylpentapeptide beta-N-acetylglucosaminyltransferase [Hyphomicrobiaceae bacterium]